MQGKYAEAEKEFRITLDLTPESAAALIGLGAAQNQSHDYAKAAEYLAKGLMAAPGYYPGRYELVRAYIGEGQWQAAKLEIGKILTENPEYGPTHKLMGNILIEEGHPEAALAEFETYLKLEPNGALAAEAQRCIADIHALQQKLQ
jgi:tetratricopeptide (TPR) repeat protein